MMTDTVIVGAGPYGLSIAAHFRQAGIPFRIFGPPMDSWINHMPKGMLLKSDGFASTLYDPEGAATLKGFCDDRGIAYRDLGLPVTLETFCSYGLAFKERMVPELESKMVTKVERIPGGFRVQVEDGDTVTARRVILAIGITHFPYLPPSLAELSPDVLTHSSSHSEVAPFQGQEVLVIGGGASSIGLAGLLKEAGADVKLLAREDHLVFHEKGDDSDSRSLWQRIRHPQSGLGPGIKSCFYSNAPGLFHKLPESVRIRAVRTSLGPSGHWCSKDKVMGRVPLLLGYSVVGSEALGGRAYLTLRSKSGEEKKVSAQHVIAGTGYRVDTDKLTFLSEEIRAQIETAQGSPILSSTFESSISGLYFTGLAAANSFGPAMRFAFGAGFACKVLTRTVKALLAKQGALVPSSKVEAVTVAQ
jgi:Pyridine nucleotide-disulphide oxidoreductase